MKRRAFLSTAAAASAVLAAPCVSLGAVRVGATHPTDRHFDAPDQVVVPSAENRCRLLILIELKGGNDGLNTVVPYADPLYYQMRPRVAVSRDSVLPLTAHTALHPALRALMPLWQNGQLAIVQGLGYPQFNLSHFRAAQIWDTASDAHQYRRDGWVARAFAHASMSASACAVEAARSRTFDAMTGAGFIAGSAEQGPLAGAAGRATILTSSPGCEAAGRGACERTGTRFPAGMFGASLHAAMDEIVATRLLGERVAIRVTLNGFDTHANQRERHADLLAQFAQGIEALRVALSERRLWNDTLVVTYSEFGRRPRENDTGGTDHGSSAPHFVTGGRVRGGLYGVPPSLSQLDRNGNLAMSVDFRCVYATVLDQWWGCDAAAVLGRRFEPLPLLRV